MSSSDATPAASLAPVPPAATAASISASCRKGRYVITFGGAAGGPAVVNLKGSAEGAVHKAVAIAKGGAMARQAGGAIEFTSDGRHPVHGHVTTGD